MLFGCRNALEDLAISFPKPLTFLRRWWGGSVRSRGG